MYTLVFLIHMFGREHFLNRKQNSPIFIFRHLFSFSLNEFLQNVAGFGFIAFENQIFSLNVKLSVNKTNVRLENDRLSNLTGLSFSLKLKTKYDESSVNAAR